VVAAAAACLTACSSVSPSALSSPAATSARSSPATGSPAPSPAPTPVRWHVTIRELPATIRDGMIATGTWHEGCPVPLDDLRLVTVSYWGFDGTGHIGRLVVNQDAARAIAEVMHTLFTSRYPIRRMIPVQAFGGNDGRSMAVDNTSAFNCRDVRGSSVWSQHAYGRAIDVNPRENPEVVGTIVRPKHARKYADRSLHAEGMIYPGDVVVRAFSAVGWGWGGYWHSLKDWQHFSANGR
jgi:D-alanyl-D-alanine carboxypeptidase